MKRLAIPDADWTIRDFISHGYWCVTDGAGNWKAFRSRQEWMDWAKSRDPQVTFNPAPPVYQ